VTALPGSGQPTDPARGRRGPAGAVPSGDSAGGGGRGQSAAGGATGAPLGGAALGGAPGGAGAIGGTGLPESGRRQFRQGAPAGGHREPVQPGLGGGGGAPTGGGAVAAAGSGHPAV